jgi:hypothetical protein
MASHEAEALKTLYRGWAAALAANPEMPLDHRGPYFQLDAILPACLPQLIYGPHVVLGDLVPRVNARQPIALARWP